MRKVRVGAVTRKAGRARPAARDGRGRASPRATIGVTPPPRPPPRGLDRLPEGQRKAGRRIRHRPWPIITTIALRRPRARRPAAAARIAKTKASIPSRHPGAITPRPVPRRYAGPKARPEVGPSRRPKAPARPTGPPPRGPPRRRARRPGGVTLPGHQARHGPRKHGLRRGWARRAVTAEVAPSAPAH